MRRVMIENVVVDAEKIRPIAHTRAKLTDSTPSSSSHNGLRYAVPQNA